MDCNQFFQILSICTEKSLLRKLPGFPLRKKYLMFSSLYVALRAISCLNKDILTNNYVGQFCLKYNSIPVTSSTFLCYFCMMLILVQILTILV